MCFMQNVVHAEHVVKSIQMVFTVTFFGFLFILLLPSVYLSISFLHRLSGTQMVCSKLSTNHGVRSDP